MDIIRVNITFAFKVRKYIERWKECLNENMFLNYFFNVMKSIALFYLSSYLTKEAASFRSLLIISIFYMRKLDALSGIKALSGQLFWILAAHILKQNFTSNAVMSIFMTFDSEIATVQDELLKTHIYLLFFRLFSMNQITVCVVISLGISLFQYLRLCEKSSKDLFLFAIWTGSLFFWFPKLTSFPVFTALALWISFTLVREY